MDVLSGILYNFYAVPISLGYCILMDLFMQRISYFWVVAGVLSVLALVGALVQAAALHWQGVPALYAQYGDRFLYYIDLSNVVIPLALGTFLLIGLTLLRHEALSRIILASLLCWFAANMLNITTEDIHIAVNALKAAQP